MDEAKKRQDGFDHAMKENNNIKHTEDEEGGLLLWKNALLKIHTSTTGPKHSEEATTSKNKMRTSPEDLDIAAQLELLSQNAHNASDASYLEDSRDGLPYLSGACRGFAFDYTDDCVGRMSTGGDMPRMHEKSRP